jgi:hypothetical protein
LIVSSIAASSSAPRRFSSAMFLSVFLGDFGHRKPQMMWISRRTCGF